MREAVGSTFLFKLMIIFIFFFASFLAIAINYSQAFRTKNQIINVLEQYVGLNSSSRDVISNMTVNSGYYREVDCEGRNEGVQINNNDGLPINGVCIDSKSIVDENNGAEKTYYQVTTYVSFNFPVIGNIFTFPVKGETKIITNPNEN